MSSNNVRKAFRVLRDLERIGSARNPKIEILNLNKKNDILKQILILAYDFRLTFGVRWVDEINTRIHGSEIGSIKAWSDFSKLSKLLINREKTGNEARTLLGLSVLKSPPYMRKWLTRIINHDLRIGISFSTIEKIFPGLLPDFGLAKANVYTSDSDMKFPAYVEPKLDGMRMCVIITNGIGVAKSYNGRDYTEVFRYIIKDLVKSADNVVVDGEAYSPTGWNETISLVKTNPENSDFNKIKQRLIFYVFDVTTHGIFKNEYTDERPLSDRRADLETIVGKINKRNSRTTIKLVPQWIAKNPKVLYKFYDRSLKLGFEGVMVKGIKSTYINDRTDNWLKLKPEHPIDGKIIGAYLGTGKNENRLGGFEVKLKNGTVINCGGGFSDSQRTDFWNMRKRLIGLPIEMKSQPDTGNKVASIRFPVFSRIREDLE